MGQLTAKIKKGWGLTCGPFPPDVVIGEANGVKFLAHWPLGNPPTIEEIEAILLDASILITEERAAKILS